MQGTELSCHVLVFGANVERWKRDVAQFEEEVRRREHKEVRIVSEVHNQVDKAVAYLNKHPDIDFAYFTNEFHRPSEDMRNAARRIVEAMRTHPARPTILLTRDATVIPLRYLESEFTRAGVRIAGYYPFIVIRERLDTRARPKPVLLRR